MSIVQQNFTWRNPLSWFRKPVQNTDTGERFSTVRQAKFAQTMAVVQADRSALQEQQRSELQELRSLAKQAFDNTWVMTGVCDEFEVIFEPFYAMITNGNMVIIVDNNGQPEDQLFIENYTLDKLVEVVYNHKEYFLGVDDE